VCTVIYTAVRDTVAHYSTRRFNAAVRLWHRHLTNMYAGNSVKDASKSEGKRGPSTLGKRGPSTLGKRGPST